MKKGLTLIELLVAIIILGVLSSLIAGNVVNSLKKSRDARRKADLEQVQRALELYYQDNKQYPASLTWGGSLTHPSNTNIIYMTKLPQDPVSGNNYLYQTDSQKNYRLYSCIENPQDQGPGVNQSGYSGKNCGRCGICKYGVSSPNTNP